MSFPKAKVKRFNELKGCAPPPGYYDVKEKEKAQGGIVSKSERFKDPKDVAAGAGNTTRTPSKQLFATPQHPASNKVVEDPSHAKVLKAKLSTAMADNAKLQQEMSAIRRELQHAINVRTSLEEQRDDLLDKNTCLQDQVKEMYVEKKNTSESVSALNKNFEDIQTSKNTLQQKLDELESIHSTVCKENAEKLKKLEEEHTTLQETIASLHERLVELQAQNEDLAATLQETSALLSNTKGENDKLEEMLKRAELQWQEEKKQYLIQVEELVFDKSKTESLLFDSEEKIKQMEVDMAKQKSESDERLEALSSQLDGEKAELVQLQNKLGDLVFEKSQLHTEIGHLEAQLKVLKSESDETRTEADKAMNVIPQLNDRIESLKSEKESMEERVEQLSKENDELQQTLEKFQSDIDDYTMKMETEKSDSQSKIERLCEEIEGLKEQKDHMAREIDEWQTDKSELDIEIAKLQCRIKVLEMENDQTKQESDQEILECKIEIGRITQEKQQMEKDMEQYGIDLLSNAAQLQSLQAKLDSKSVVLEELTQDHDHTLDELKEQKEKYEDLECQLQQTRADFIKRCDERDELIKKNEAKDKSLAIMSQQVSEMNTKIQDLNQTIEKKQTEYDTLSVKYGELEKHHKLSTQQVSNYKQQIVDYTEHLQQKCDECDDLQQKCDDYDMELSLSAKEIVDLTERIEAMKTYNAFLYEKLICVALTGYQITETNSISNRDTESKDTEVSKTVESYEKEISELRSQLEENNGSEELVAELEKYKNLYEELQAKVEPFLGQIDSYELEKQHLLGLTQTTQAEMEKLGLKYAQLLGHQNNKQKIKHVVKIKEDNNALRRDNMQLKEQISKLKRQVQKHEEKTAPRRFDPSKAFELTRENMDPKENKSPLRDVNRK